MKIAIVGLGLIGGSLARAFKAGTDNYILGWDIDPLAREKAFKAKCVDEILTHATLSDCDCVLVALYPDAAVDYIVSRASEIKPGAIVADMCGIKRSVCAAVEETARNAGFTFIGAHPMAGREQAGFEHSEAGLFQGAPLIVTPYAWTDEAEIERFWAIMRPLGFARLQRATPEEHDEIIAYTSQLAHLMTCAYMTDPLSQRHEGFSAGSFQDMSRVARLNEDMWSELFIKNRDYLCREAELLAGRILDLARAVRSGDDKALKQMLRRSRELKEAMLAREEGALAD